MGDIPITTQEDFLGKYTKVLSKDLKKGNKYYCVKIKNNELDLTNITEGTLLNHENNKYTFKDINNDRNIEITDDEFTNREYECYHYSFTGLNLFGGKKSRKSKKSKKSRKAKKSRKTRRSRK